MNYGYPRTASGSAIALAGGGAPRHGYPRIASGSAIALAGGDAPRHGYPCTSSGRGDGASRKRCFSDTTTPHRLRPSDCARRRRCPLTRLRGHCFGPGGGANQERCSPTSCPRTASGLGDRAARKRCFSRDGYPVPSAPAMRQPMARSRMARLTGVVSRARHAITSITLVLIQRLVSSIDRSQAAPERKIH